MRAAVHGIDRRPAACGPSALWSDLHSPVRSERLGIIHEGASSATYMNLGDDTKIMVQEGVDVVVSELQQRSDGATYAKLTLLNQQNKSVIGPVYVNAP